jgi:RNA polymerase sigma-70 factor (ECF subfamily)
MAHLPVHLLIAALASGQPEAYRELYDRLAPALFGVARAMLKNSSDAEDAVQDVFVELVRRRERLESIADLQAYLFAMLRSAASKKLRSQQSERRRLSQMGAACPDEKDVFLADELSAALEALPLEQRAVIALKIDAELTFAQIAEVLNLNPNTAASRYRYAIEKLRQMLD